MSKDYKTELLTQGLPHTELDYFPETSTSQGDKLHLFFRNTQDLELGRVSLKIYSDQIEIKNIDLVDNPQINLQKSGIGKKIISNIIDFCEESKIDKITLNATGVGSYVWAKLATPDQPGKVNKEVLDRLSQSSINIDEKSALEKILQNGDPQALRCVANSVHGKFLLLNLNDYAATIDLNKDKQLIREYTKLSHSQVVSINDLIKRSYETEVIF